MKNQRCVAKCLTQPVPAALRLHEPLVHASIRTMITRNGLLAASHRANHVNASRTVYVTQYRCEKSSGQNIDLALPRISGLHRGPQKPDSMLEYPMRTHQYITGKTNLLAGNITVILPVTLP